MEKDQIIILKNRGLVSIAGEDAKDFLQNIITNDINKVSQSNSIFAALLSPQGKYLFEFFVVKVGNGYLLDCDGNTTIELIDNLTKYKLRSKIKIENFSSNYVVGVINHKNFKSLQDELDQKNLTFQYRESPIFVDPRNTDLGARIISPLDKLYLTIKKLNLKISESNNYLIKSYLNGIPVEGLKNLQNQLFGLEVNFEKLNAIDFKKGCYVGRENTARMKVKKKVRRKLMPIKAENEVKIGEEITYNDTVIGKILIDKPFPFALVKLFNPDFSTFKNERLKIKSNNIELIS